MSNLGKILFIVAGLSILLLSITRFILGGWLNFMFFPLGLFLVTGFASLFIDIKFYFEFLTMKTTKNGFNMFSAVILCFLSLAFINYLSYQYAVSWDLTTEKINSVSKESKIILKNLTSDLKFKVFYRGEKDKASKKDILNKLKMYQEASNKISVKSINAYVKNIISQKYLKNVSDLKNAVVFVEYLEKKVKILYPISEDKITKAIVKLTRKKLSNIYFITGHGEKSIFDKNLNGLSNLILSLKDLSFKVKQLNLIKSLSIPKDASVLAIIGPTGLFLDTELKLILQYLNQGGSLFLAIDPGTKHNLALLSKSIGIEFKNNYILNNRLQVKGRGSAGALGLIFSRVSPITKAFNQQQFMLLDLASELIAAPQKADSLQVNFLVQSPPNSYSVNQMNSKTIKAANKKERGVILAMSSEGKLNLIKKSKSKKLQKAKDFLAVVFADSDFLSNKDFNIGLNSAMALNSLEFLSKENNLINIKTKKPKGTQLTLTSSDSKLLIIMGIFIPVLCLILTSLLFFRRRNS